MDITRANQEELLNFIKIAMGKAEKDQIEISRINVSNVPYKLYGKPMYKGNLFIIGNNAYIKKVKRYYRLKPKRFIKKNFKFKLNKFKKYIDKEHKGIIIEFTDNLEDGPYKITKVVGINNNKDLYLDSAMDIYDNNSRNKASNNVAIKHFENYLNTFDYIFSYKSRAKQKVLKALNGKPIKKS